MLLNSTGLKVKVIVSSLLLLTSWMNLTAAPLTPEQALNRLQSSSTAKRVVGNTRFVLAHTEKLDNQDYLFVFNRNNDGFIIASADDRMPALLGYSDNGAFDLATASPALKWWLEQYAVQASQSLNSEIASLSDDVESDISRAVISPLITTHWNQRAPFNNVCPSDAKGKCVTGCVATAMAQVIKYHGYPSQGVGTHSYDWNGTKLSYDYGNASFDYNNMLDEYNYNSDSVNPTPAQEAAVANLMYACGVGVNMSYTSNESGAQDAFVAYALQKYFNYDAGIQYLKRAYFSDSEWENIVYKELEEKRPVIYGGRSEKGGHEFICDGYKDGYFHINWGWGSLSDGYFLLSALNPSNQGTGGNGEGYNNDQTITCGIQPNKNNLKSWYPLYATGGVMATDVLQSESESKIFITFTKGGLFNYYPDEINTDFYFKEILESGEETIYSIKTPMSFDANDGKIHGTQFFWMNLPTDLTPGDHKLGIVIKVPNGKYQNLPVPAGMSDNFDISVDESGKVKIKNMSNDLKPSIKIEKFSPKTDVISGEKTNFEIDIYNVGLVEYSGNIFVRTFDMESNEKLTEINIQIDLHAMRGIKGASIDLAFLLPDGDPLPDGKYCLQCFDVDDNPLMSEVQVLTILPSPYIPKSISLDKTEIPMTNGETNSLTATIYPETAVGVAKIWKSSNDKIATVDDNGNVTAIGVGKAIITVTCGKVSAECEVTCNPIVGDADWNGSVTITDAVDISNYVVGKKTAPEDWVGEEWLSFYVVGANANKDEDGKISFADASAAVTLALEQTVTASMQSRINAYAGFNDAFDELVIGALSADAKGGSCVPVTLDNSVQYVALQADITVPEGLTVDVKPGSRIANSHSFVTRRINDNTIRVAIFNLGNKSFAENNQPLFEVISDSNILDLESIVITNILASDSDAIEYVLGSRSDASAVGMIGVSNDNVSIVKGSDGILIKNIIGKKVEVYTLDGRIVRSFVANQDSETINLSSGVYVVKVGNQTLKIVL